jgi:hypothetical protein
MILAAPRRLSRAVPRLARCAAADPRLFARALCWRAALPLLKRVIPVRTLGRWMRREHAAGTTGGAARRVASVERLLRDGGRLVIPGNCYERSLLLYRFLSETGADASLVFGMRREAGRLAGHAWIEMDGRVLADPTTAAYESVFRFGP